MSANSLQPTHSAMPMPSERRAAEQLALDQAFFDACAKSDFESLAPLIGRANPFWKPREGAFGVPPHAFSLALGRANYPLLRLLLSQPRVQEWLREPEQDHLLADCVHQGAHGLVQILLPFFTGERIESTCLRDNSPSLHDLAATPLMIAADTGDEIMVDLLLQAGASPARQNKAGQTALMHLATANADPHALRACFARLLPVSDPTLRDIDGRTALIAAAESGNLFAVQTLRPVSDLFARNSDRSDAWWMAIVRNRHAVVDFLAEFVSERKAAMAFLNLGPEKMPKRAARLEAKALSDTVTQAAREQTTDRAGSQETTPESALPSISGAHSAPLPSRSPTRL